jgi:two-component system KDP operon response regulator KdpE
VNDVVNIVGGMETGAKILVRLVARDKLTAEAKGAALARIRTAIRHRFQRQGERPVYCVDGLAVDLVRRIVKVNEKEVKLSRKEYDILSLLVAHAGKVLTHQFILREVWKTPTDVQYLRIYIKQLRQKIEPDPQDPRYILTEMGVGYRLHEPD